MMLAVPEAGVPLTGFGLLHARLRAAFCNRIVERGTLLVAITVATALSLMVLADVVTPFSANVMAMAALVTALGAAGGLVKVLWKIRVEAQIRDEEHGRLLAEVSNLTYRCTELQGDILVLTRDRDTRDRQIEQLEFRANDQAGQLLTMHAIMSDFGAALKQDNVTIIQLSTLYQRYELVAKEKPPLQHRSGE